MYKAEILKEFERLKAVGHTIEEDDCGYSLRWQLIKRYFSRHFDASQTHSHSKIKHREKSIDFGSMKSVMSKIYSVT